MPGSDIVSKPLRVSNTQAQITRVAKSAAALASAAFGADAAGAGTDHFITAAMRADDVHEHVSKRFLNAIGVAAAVPANLRFAVIGRVAGDHIENFFFARSRQVRNRTIERLLLHLWNFFQWQLGLPAVR